ncbi:HD domain-containing protein [Citreimonas salinaria]|uniref:Metal dependent phosphohydrolase n=1 Tax=Citreimonas salinaria TaxID=321339 RepID=A0A1H3HC51_9RHOB|nr:HD domain-containing protein [Citreimonas salinaria]SDY12199.1 metal dependent phosphohydrolase [Citreimonas salinaria]
MSRLITSAALFAAQAHQDQTRKDGVAPYINHVLEVADLVACAEAGEIEIASALLHDVVEDSETGVNEISRRFGPRVAQIVDGLTDDPAWEELPRPERKALQAEHMARATQSVRLIKIADQTSNLRDLVRLPKGWTRREAADYIAGAKRVVDACRGASPFLEVTFDNAVAEAMQKIEEFPS